MANLFEAYGLEDPVVTPEPEKPSPRGLGGYVKDMGIATAKGVIGLPEAVVGMADLVTGGQAGKIAEQAGFRPKVAKSMLSEYFSPQQKAADAAVNEAKGFLPTVGAMLQNPSTIVNQALESAPSMIGGAGVARGAMKLIPGMSPIVAGAIGEGATAAGQNAEQVRQEDPNGTLTGKQSAILVASGLLTGGIGLASGKLANKLGIGDVETMLASGHLGPVGAEAAAAGAKKGVARKVAEGMAVEGVGQELPQSYQEQVAQNLAQGKPWNEGAAEAGAQGMLVGTAMGGGGNLVSHIGEDNKPVTPPTAKPVNPVDAGGSVSDGMSGTSGMTPEQADAESRRLDAEAANPASVIPTPGLTPDQEGQALGRMDSEAEADLKAVKVWDSKAPAATILDNIQSRIKEQLAPDQERITRLSTLGEKDYAELETKKLNARMMSKAVPVELSLIADQPTVSDLHVRPEFSRSYFADRMAGVAPGTAAARAAMFTAWGDIATQLGLPDTFQAKAIEAAKAKPITELGNRFQGFVETLSGKGVITAHPRQGEIAKWINEYRDEALKAVEAGLYSAPRKPDVSTKPAIQSVAPATNRSGVPDASAGVGADLGVQRPAALAVDTGNTGTEPAGGTVPLATGEASVTVDQAAHEAATSHLNDLPQPTDGQKEAGNYKKGHITLNGLDLSIENPAGSQRSGVSPDGKAWTNTLNHHYGYIKGTVGNDKDHFDLFVKPETPLDYSGSVYVVDQIHPHTGKFDEHKALVGWNSEQEARDAYHSNYDKNWKGLQAITAMPFTDFKSWVKDGPKNQPLAQTTQPAASPEAVSVSEPEKVEPTAPAGSYRPGDQFTVDGTKWKAEAVAHTGKELTATTVDAPFKRQRFQISQPQEKQNGPQATEAVPPATQQQEAPAATPVAKPAAGDGVAVPSEVVIPKLSKDLTGAKPRYSYGDKKFELSFANDIDRAAYITAQPFPSKRDEEYVKFVSDATGLTDKQVREHGAKVRDAIKAQAKTAEPGVLTVADIYGAKEPIKMPFPKATEKAPAAEPVDSKLQSILESRRKNGASGQNGEDAAQIIAANKPVAPKLSAKEQARILRETETSTFTGLANSADLIDKPVESLAEALKARLPDSKPEQIAKMAKELHKQLAKKAVELAKAKHRDPSVYQAAVDGALLEHGIQGDADKTNRFQAGWAHALAGKTKSTLSGDMLADQVRGYEGARAWMKTEEGAAWYEGRPVAKLQNTGLDLRRHWELMQAQMKSNESDVQKAWKQIERATARADLFAPLLPDTALPGFKLYVQEVRSNLITFKDWLEDGNDRWYGSTSWGRKSKQATHLDYILAGKRYPGSLSVEDKQKFETSESYRVQYLQDAAARYLDKAKALIGFLDGTKSVKEAAEKFDALFMNPDYKPENNNGNSYDWYKGLNEAGRKMATKDALWGSRSPYDFFKLRSQSAWTETLIEKEASIALPTRADPLSPPKLDRVTRDGLTDQRKGASITPDEFKKTFGFADVGFGKWVNSKQDQDHLNYSYDAFMDLANHFGVAPKNLGFGGQLHFTIGALGHGKFAAHFQRAQPVAGGSVQVINVTNTRGDGTVYHEWAHALDHNLGGEWRSTVRGQLLRLLKARVLTESEIDKKAKDFLIGGSYWMNDKKADKVDAAARAMRYYVGTNTGATAYKTNADKLGKDYWGNEEELIARAAEAWAVDTMGGTNTYLVNPDWAGEGKASPEKGHRGTPYPTGHERKFFAEVYTALAKAIKWSDGKPTITAKDFQAALPENPGEDRRKYLLDPKNMQALYDELVAEKTNQALAATAAAEEAARADREAMDAAAAEKLKELSTIDPPTPSETTGELSDDDLSAMFDQAAAELREETQEKPQAAAPGETPAIPQPPTASDKWSIDELNELLEKASNADLIAISGAGGIPGVLTIQEVGALGNTEHYGDGMFETRGVDASGKSWTISWDGGGAMRRLSTGKPYTNVSLSGTGVAPFPSGVKRAIEKARDDLADARRAAAPKAPFPSPNAVDAALNPSANALIAEAAKLGVKGANEALTGLAKLFGSQPGRLNSFPGGFDEETYKQAKPHFQAALKSFQEAGKTLKDLFKMLISQFGDGIKEYAIRFAKDEGLTSQLGAQSSASSAIADKVAARLAVGHSFDWRILFGWSDEAFGGTQGEGKYTPKDAYDAMEMGVNRYLMSQQGRAFNPNSDREAAALTVAALERVTALLPTQTKRTAEQDQYQQFSTVPALAFVANWAANVTSADTMMEPSAGLGGIALFAKNAGASLVLNELSSRRAALLQEMFPGAKVFTENAEQIDNILPVDIKPTVVVMNPPFSSSASTGVKKTAIGAKHVEQALARLVDGGRLVAIVGEGMTMDKPAFKDWWKKISAQYDLRAVIPMDGSGYAKYGTTFDNAILVIDKVAPSGKSVVTTKAETYNQLVGFLSEIRNDRPTANLPSNDRDGIERDAAESALGETSGPDSGIDAQGNGILGDGQSGGQAQSGAGGNRPVAGDLGNGQPASTVRQPGRPGTGAGNNARTGRGNNAGNSQRDLSTPENQGRQPGAVEDSGVTIGSSDTAAAALTESVFESYQPQRLSVAGAKPHPGPLVQSAAMASVLPPAATYTPNLPKETITGGKLSLAQIESVVYAGQAHQEFLEKDAQGVQYRRGFFIGDGTGVGKGREIGGIILDNIRQGRKKHVWVTEKQPLLKDAQRDFKGVGGDPALIFPQGTSKGTDADADIKQKSGIVFTTYSTLRSASNQQKGNKAFKKGSEVVVLNPMGSNNGIAELVSINPSAYKLTVKQGGRETTHPFAQIYSIDGERHWLDKVRGGNGAQSRLDQLVKWLGDDFDGVIAFDEAHNAGNAIAIKGERGSSDPSAAALAVVEIQKRLPKARIVYVSATGATEVSNLSFATRLGLWGPGTPFANLGNFIAEMTAGGLATMELVARDMKQMGAYLARSLSFDGVSYSRTEHELTDIQTDIYNRLADAWQVTLQNMTEALKVTGAAGENGEKKKNDAKKNMKSAYWGAQQRFFNQIITAMQMPTVLDSIDQDLKDGKAVVLQLVNTNEAQQERALEKRKEDGESADLEDLDLTPRDQLIQMVEKAFPVSQYEDYVDEDGKKGSRLVKDSNGVPVQNRKAVAMRDKLVQDLKDIRVPDGPLELLINHFGPEITAEITGRKRRIVAGKWNKDHKGQGEAEAFEQKRGGAAVQADAAAFMDDKKQILIFSDAGGTGYSFHADLTKKNQRDRKHYLIQPGWRANKAVQGLGRSHRTNQKSAPHYVLVATNIPAHKRFLSSIARRLDQLGALTKGQRDTSSGGLFSEKDNLESIYAQQASKQLIQDIKAGQIPGLSFDEFMRQMGLEDIVGDDGNIAEAKYPKTSQFLNRLLSLRLDMQDKVFNAFIERMEEKIDVAAQRGELDAGMQTIKALSAKITSDDVAYTDPRTGADTRLVELELTQPTHFYDFPIEANESRPIEWVQNIKSGRVWAKILSGQVTTRSGAIVDRFRMRGTGGTQLKPATDFEKIGGVEHYRAITKQEAQALWEKENSAKPQTYTEKIHMVVGAVLPIWDRLKTGGVLKVSRTQTTDGQRLLGMVVAEKDIADVRKRLNVSSPASKLAPEQVMTRILKGDTGELANGWTLKRAKVSDDLRIELSPGYLSKAASDELIGFGVMKERIQWTERYFVPTGKDGVPVLQALFKNKPLVELSNPSQDGAVFSARDSAPAAKLPLARIEQIVKEATAKIAGLVPVRVVASPESIGLTVAPDVVASGVTMPNGDVYVFQSGVGSVLDVQRVVFHEVFHRGLQNSMSPADYVSTMLDIAAKDDRVQQYANNWKNSNAAVTEYAKLKKLFTGSELQAHYEALAVEEGLAQVAEDIKADSKGGSKYLRVKKLLAWLARTADKLGLSKLAEHIRAMAYNDAEKFVIDAISKAGGPTRPGGSIRQSAGNYFYSALAKEIRNSGSNAQPAAGWKSTIAGLVKAGKVKADEVQWTGLNDWLDQQTGKVTKEQVGNYLAQNGVQVQETTLFDDPDLTGEKEKRAELEAMSYEDLTDEADSAGVFTPFANRQNAIDDIINAMRDNYDGDSIGDTKYSQYQLPGGTNYREVLLTLPVEGEPKPEPLTALPDGYHVIRDSSMPEGRQYGITPPGQIHARPMGDRHATPEAAKAEALALVNNERLSTWAYERDKNSGAYKSSHWDQPNVLAHIRVNDRVDSTGAKILFIEEIQSDWSQQARKDGINTEQIMPDGTTRTPTTGVPNAPFISKTDAWVSLSLKRIIKMAVDGGYAKVAFVNGEQSAERYDLSKQISRVEYHEGLKGQTGTLEAFDHGGQSVIARKATHEELPDLIGKEIAAKLVAQKADNGGARKLSGLDLKVGGEGMEVFYNQIVPNIAKDVLRKLGGGKMETLTINQTEGFAGNERKAAAKAIQSEQPGFTITDALRQSAAGGMPMFRTANATINKVVSELNDRFSHTGTLSAWHKTVGTQYNLAQRNPFFKRTFDAVQNFINDTSYYATEAANLAPTLLPQLQSWKDITRAAIKSDDNLALAKPVFEGTLVWGRDESGKLIKMKDLERQYADLSSQEKARMLLKKRIVTEDQLKRWLASPLDIYDGAVRNRFEANFLKEGVVFTDAELKSQFNLTPEQIKLYREFRSATDKSLTNLAITDMLKFGGDDVAPIRDAALAEQDVSKAGEMLAEYLRSLTDIDPDRAKVLQDTADKMIAKADRAADLMKRGYAPLSRFGHYTLDIVDESGKRVYFGMFESKSDSNKMASKMRENYPDATMRQGTVSEEEYKLFAGVSPETIELFGEMLGLEATGTDAKNQAFQEYLKIAKSQRSAMKRLIQRKGISGFSEDATRVLAGFVYSNARQSSSNMHTGEIANSVNDIPQGQGEIKDAAMKLMNYVQNPQEEAQAVRGLLFAQYIGGSVASAMVNLTQPFTMTLPWLSQYGGIAKAAKQMTAATRDALKESTGDIALDRDLKLAEEQGIVSPQEVHQMQAQAAGRGALQSGDGTTAGAAKAMASNSVARVMLAWGKLFGATEQFNRRSTFIASYRTAVEQGIVNPAGFAAKAISETQGIYNKGNKPIFGRTAIGATLFTFKQFGVAYIEMLDRMARSGPEGKKAALYALGIMMLAAGGGGLPGADDLDDIISGFMQALGYNFDSKAKRRAFLTEQLGSGAAHFIEHGITGLPGVPIDLSGRLGLGNLIPGTGLLTKKADHTRDVAELAGPAGDLAKRGFQAAGKLVTGEIGGAVNAMSPQAVRNLSQAYDMANMGMYRDQSGKKVIETDAADAVSKAIGFNPQSVKQVQDATGEVQRAIGLNKLRETEIADKWAQGIFEKDKEKVDNARADLKAWNDANPDMRIRIDYTQLNKRLRSMNMSKEQRIERTAPKEIKATIRRELQ